MIVECYLDVKYNLAQLFPCQNCISDCLVECIFEDANQSLEMTSPPWGPAQVEFPLDVLVGYVGLKVLISPDLLEPLGCPDKGSSVVRVDNRWSPPPCDKTFETGQEFACL